MVATQEITNKKVNLKSNSKNEDNLKKKQISVQENKFKKACQKGDVQFLSKNNLKQNSKCWLCSKSHRLMNCYQFLKQSLEERKDFVQNKKNCLSKSTNFMPVRQSLPAERMAAPKNTTLYSTKTKQMD